MIFRNLLASVFIMSSINFNYYFIGFYMKYIEGNFYLNSVMAQLAEFIGFLSSGFLINSFGIRNSMVF